MSEPSNEKPETSAEFDADAIYRQIGIYVVSFQYLEDLLFQICWFFSESPYSDIGRLRLVNKRFPALVGEAQRRVGDFLAADGRSDSDFVRNFCAHMGECRKIERERNRVVHSAYIHLEGGGELLGIVRSDSGKARDRASVEFDRTYLTEKSLEVELKRLAEVISSVSVDLRQLTIWGPEAGSRS
jgi:hypothetical protein